MLADVKKTLISDTKFIVCSRVQPVGAVFRAGGVAQRASYSGTISIALMEG
jgi:hypothetical protein